MVLVSLVFRTVTLVFSLNYLHLKKPNLKGKTCCHGFRIEMKGQKVCKNLVMHTLRRAMRAVII